MKSIQDPNLSRKSNQVSLTERNSKVESKVELYDFKFKFLIKLKTFSQKSVHSHKQEERIILQSSFFRSVEKS
jgi:hypothetical protein